MRAAFDAGPTAVLSFGSFTVVVISRTVGLIDRALYYANGLDPQTFDLIVVKCPHTEYQMYDAWVEKNFNIDAPGATSADLLSLGHTICRRPVYPLDDNVTFEPKPLLYRPRVAYSSFTTRWTARRRSCPIAAVAILNVLSMSRLPAAGDGDAGACAVELPKSIPLRGMLVHLPEAVTSVCVTSDKSVG